MSDVIDTLVGIAPGSNLDSMRGHRAEARSQSQATYVGLFEPEDLAGVTAQERFAVATFVVGLHDQPDTAAFYASRLPGDDAFKAAVAAEAKAAATHGPYGAYPTGPLTAEDAAGPTYEVSEAARAALGARLAAAFAHVHALVFHPRDATPQALQALLDAGWSTTDIVTLSQMVAFLSYQIRVVAGLRSLKSRL